MHLLRKCGFTKPQQILGFRSGIAPLQTAPFCHLPSAFSLYRFWRLMLHPVVPALRPVASDKTPKHPMFMQVVALLHLKCAPGGGKRKTRRHGDAETRRRGDAEIRRYRRVPPPGGSLPVRSDESKAGIDPSLSEVIRTVPNRSEPKTFFWRHRGSSPARSNQGKSRFESKLNQG